MHSPTLFVNAQPTQALLWLELVSIKARPSQMSKATHTLTHTYAHTHAHSQGKQIPFAAFPGGFNDWDSRWLGLNSASLVRVSFPPPCMTAVNSLNRTRLKVEDMEGWHCGWVGGILLHPSFIPPSRLVLTPSLIRNFWKLLRHDKEIQLFQRLFLEPSRV